MQACSRPRLGPCTLTLGRRAQQHCPADCIRLDPPLLAQEVAEAAAAWIHAACSHSSSRSGLGQPQPAGPDLFDRTLAALTAERSQNVIALAVSVACRSSVEAVVQATMQQPQDPAQAGSPGRANAAEQGLVPKLMAWAGSAAGEQLVLKVVSIFTRQVGNPATR